MQTLPCSFSRSAGGVGRCTAAFGLLPPLPVSPTCFDPAPKLPLRQPACTTVSKRVAARLTSAGRSSDRGCQQPAAVQPTLIRRAVWVRAGHGELAGAACSPSAASCCLPLIEQTARSAAGGLKRPTPTLTSFSAIRARPLRGQSSCCCPGSSLQEKLIAAGAAIDAPNSAGQAALHLVRTAPLQGLIVGRVTWCQPAAVSVHPDPCCMLTWH